MSNQQIYNGTGNYIATDDVTRDTVTEKVQIVAIGQVTSGTTLVEAPVDASLGLLTKVSNDIWHRNPKVLMAYDDKSAQAPISYTTLITYACPVNRRVVIASAFLVIWRDGLATTPAMAQLELGYGTAGTASMIYKWDGSTAQNASADPMPMVYLHPTDNALYVGQTAQLAQPLYLPTGNNSYPLVFINRVDNSTGGTTAYKYQVYLIEYDA